ncbi:winged helix-turn-helix domain-containing protein [Streptomyces californicus]|uniref:Winged helix-turn-helix domain-containing protein n=1 Tax=Streptomyces californicus TaxID=67351 RepID=A0ABD7CSS2_9ACTN|nr:MULTISPECIES: BTAD domain-containing putative transcriptional regulator [Streptomyces]QRV30750.1 winged helix-turn-helix domain-containing protein [Streptomyces californicus]QRV33641.1 winged helix-turn-helix domain-containing protein [Streptomyces californicus]QRV44166.1 winged helix-turn-helix domain-containing protein [Streptomyces californicus]QRV50854.1 winged helix-turn-helix domain-containing protein [Streptomyces californicus]
MRYGVLGPLAVWDAEGQPVRVPEAKVRALLANLLVHGGGPVPADRLIEDLWASSPPGGSTNTLQTKVSQLRRVLGREQVVREPAGYRLLLADDVVDAMRFQELAVRARAHREPAVKADLFADALALWRGPAYADVAESLFARGEIARLEELRLAVVEDHAEVRLTLGEHTALAAELGTLVARHPLRERLRMAHMRALYRSGRQGDALQSFEELRRELAEELGASPGPEAAALHRAILRQEPQLATPAIGSRSCRTNLPAPLTPLIGRREAAAQVLARLDPRAPARLVTLTGLGGVGKTRLAIAAAGDAAERYTDGVWLVELAGLGAPSDPDDIAERVITTLGLCDTAATEPDLDDLVGWLCRAVADKQLLILLDNCEHLVESVALFTKSLLSAVPAAHLLLTSQEALDIPGEVVHPVPPLALPELTDPQTVARSSAVELFVQRAAAAVPGFALDADNAAAVSTVCRRLDGIPLALELVASRLRTLSPQELAARLDDRFARPDVRVRGLPDRQQTLRGMLDWSWQLLTPDERTVLRRLVVHADGCVMASAQAVCADGKLPAERVPDLLSRLVDRSLVVREGDRFRLLESVAAYCAERLAEAGEENAVRARFVRYCTESAERESERLRGPEQRCALDRLNAETVNLRRALDLAVAQGPAGYAVRLVNALGWYWFLRGRFPEARRSLRSALAADADAAPGARRAAGAWLAGVELRASPGDAAPLPVDEDPTAGVEDPVLRGRLQWFVGTGLTGRGHLDEGRALVEAALAGARAVRDRWGEAAALVELAGHGPAPEGAAELGAALFREVDDRWGQLRANRSLALAAEHRGDPVRTERLHREGLLMAEELGLWTEVVETLTLLGGAALADGLVERATELYERALSVSAERAYHRGEIRAEIGLGHAARLRGDRDAAASHLHRALAKSRSSGHATHAADALEELGLLTRA